MKHAANCKTVREYVLGNATGLKALGNCSSKLFVMSTVLDVARYRKWNTELAEVRDLIELLFA